MSEEEEEFINPIKKIRQVKKELTNFATEYTIGKYRIKYTGHGNWGIYEGNSTLSYNKTTKEFDYEPLNSSKDAKFYKEHRFSLKEAKEIIDILGDHIK